MKRSDRDSTTFKTVIRTLEAKVLTGNVDEDERIQSVCASDLMSDVLSFSSSQALLVTGLTNPQVVRTADVTDIAAICFVFGKIPRKETIELAENSGIILLSTDLSLYCTCGKLYDLNIPGCSVKT